ncbi:MAG: FadR/GntR family transcriptional regulator [Christensenellales bacterium]|jgi:GntR family transcriptional repressor for pyruvate dehydrogenase complex
MNKQAANLRPIPNRSVVDRVIDRITDAIISGQYAPGEKIPTEDQLAAMLGVARNSVREAVKVLVSLGVLEIRRAEGTFVTEGTRSELFNPMLYGVIAQKSGLADLIEMRRVLEEGVTRLAIEKGTDEDMNKIAKQAETFIAALESKPYDYDRIMQCDINFHKSIEDACHNSLLPNICQVITRLTVPSRMETLRRGLEGGNLQYFIDCHKMLAQVVTTRNEDSVARAIAYHYNMWREQK